MQKVSPKPLEYRIDEATGIQIAIYAAKKPPKWQRTWVPFKKYTVFNRGHKRSFLSEMKFVIQESPQV